MLDEAKAMGLPCRNAELVLEELTPNLREGIDDLPDSLTTGWQESRSPKRTNFDTATAKARRSVARSRGKATVGHWGKVGRLRPRDHRACVKQFEDPALARDEGMPDCRWITDKPTFNY